MSTNQTSSQSIIASVAAHEHTLLEQLETSKNEARESVDHAWSQARDHAQKAESALSEEMAEIRRAKAAARDGEFQATVSEAEAKLESVRANAAAKVDNVTKDVLALFLPKTTGGN